MNATVSSDSIVAIILNHVFLISFSSSTDNVTAPFLEEVIAVDVWSVTICRDEFGKQNRFIPISCLTILQFSIHRFPSSLDEISFQAPGISRFRTRSKDITFSQISVGAQDGSIGSINLSIQSVGSIDSVTHESSDSFNNLSATAAPNLDQSVSESVPVTSFASQNQKFSL